MPSNENTEQFVALLKAVPGNHELYGIVKSVLLPELDLPFEINFLPTSDFKHFEEIYRRRHEYMKRNSILNYGILESIPRMVASGGKLSSASLNTSHYRGYVWMDLGGKRGQVRMALR